MTIFLCVFRMPNLISEFTQLMPIAIQSLYHGGPDLHTFFMSLQQTGYPQILETARSSVTS